MSGEISIKMTAVDQELIRRLKASEAQIASLERKLKDAGTAGSAAAKKTGQDWGGLEKGIGSAAAAVRGFVGGFAGLAGITTLLATISAEMKDLEERGQAIKKESLTVEAAQAKLINNMASATPEERQSMIDRSAEISLKTGVAEQYITGAMADAYSASGGDKEQAIAAVERSAQVNATDPDAIARYAGTLIDLSKATGSKDAGVNQGFMQWLGGASRVVDAQAQATNIPGAIISGTDMGYGRVEVASLYAGLTNAIGDFQGSISKTSLIGLSNNLREFFGEKGEGKGRAAEGDLFGQLSALQGDAALREKFIAGGGMSGVAGEHLSTVEKLVSDPESAVNQSVIATAQTAPTEDAAFVQRANESIQALSTTAEAQLGVQQRMLEVLQQQNKLAQPEAGAAAVYDSAALDTTLASAGVGETQRKVDGWGYWIRRMAGDSEQEAFSTVAEKRIDATKERESFTGKQSDVDERLRGNLDAMNALNASLVALNQTLKKNPVGASSKGQDLDRRLPVAGASY